MANPYGGYPYGAGYAGYAQPGAPTYPPQVCCRRELGQWLRMLCGILLSC